MATTPFTLAALATSAVPGLSVDGTRPHTSGSGGAFTSAVLSTSAGEVIIRVPATPSAEVQQSAELLAHAALAEGARGRLSFAVPVTLGITRAGDTRAVVSSFLEGSPAGLDNLEGDSGLLQEAAEAIADIHELPVGIVRAGGLPTRSADEAHEIASRLVQRTADTGMLPATVQRRWQDVLDSEPVWSFEPVPLHGSLSAELLLAEGSELRGILGWGEFSLGDPAIDLGWLLSAGTDVFEAALAHYTHRRGVAGQQELVVRSRLYHELEVAKWLLHGVESRDQSIVDDAVTMLDRLVDRLGLLGAPLPPPRVLSETEVEQMLDETPDIDYDPRSETAEFESLDEDRAFEIERDFDDPVESVPEQATADQTAAERTADDEPEPNAEK